MSIDAHPAPSPAPAPPTSLPCPHCGTGTLTPASGPATPCTHCHLAAPTALVAETLRIDWYLVHAPAQRASTLERIAAAMAAPPPGPPTGAAPSRRPGTSAGPLADSSVRILLLVAGATLLGLAGLIFAAVAWTRLSPTDRLLTLGAAGVVVAGFGAMLRRRVPAAAEAISAVGAVFVATTAYAAPLGHLAPAWAEQHWAGWIALASTGLAVAAVGVHRATRLRTWACAVTLAAVVGALALGVQLAVTTHDPAVFAVITALAAAVGTALASRGLADRSLTALATAGLTVSAVAGLLPALGPADVATLLTAGVVACGLAALAPALGRVFEAELRPLDPAFGVGVLLGFAAYALVAAVTGHDRQVGQLLLALIAGGCLLAAGQVTKPALPLAAAGTSWLIALLDLRFVDHRGSWALLAVSALATAATAATGRTDTLSWRHLAWAGGGFAAASWLVWVGPRSPRHSVELTTVPIAVALLAAGALWAWRTHRDTGELPPSLAGLLPGLLPLTLPALVRAGQLVADGSDERTLWLNAAYLVGGAVLLAVGARLRLLAATVLGAATVAVAALGQLVALSGLLPGWASLAIAGTVLLAVGTQWEWARGVQRTTTSTLAGMR